MILQKTNEPLICCTTDASGLELCEEAAMPNSIKGLSQVKKNSTNIMATVNSISP